MYVNPKSLLKIIIALEWLGLYANRHPVRQRIITVNTVCSTCFQSEVYRLHGKSCYQRTPETDSPRFSLNYVSSRFHLNHVISRFLLNYVILRFPLNYVSSRFPLNYVSLRCYSSQLYNMLATNYLVYRKVVSHSVVIPHAPTRVAQEHCLALYTSWRPQLVRTSRKE